MAARFQTEQFRGSKNEPCIVIIDDDRDPLYGAWFGEILSVRGDPNDDKTILVEAIISGPRVGEQRSEEDPAVQLSLNGIAYRVVPATLENVAPYIQIASLSRQLAHTKDEAVRARSDAERIRTDTDLASRRSQTLEKGHKDFQDRLTSENHALRTRKASDLMTDPRLIHVLAKTVIESPDLLEVLYAAIAVNKPLSDKLRLHALRRQTA
jgi:hypothetical protein